MFSGSLVAIVTPMRSGRRIDWDAWERLLESARWPPAPRHRGRRHHRRVGDSDGCGAAGAARAVRARALARGRMALIAGAGSSSTATTVERARRLSAPPGRWPADRDAGLQPPDAGGAVSAFRGRGGRGRKPIVLYNVPARTAVDMLPATVARLAQLPRIVGVKEAVPRWSGCASWSRAADAISWCCRAMMPAPAKLIAAGARGVISVTANVVPKADGRDGAPRRCAASEARARARCAAAGAARGAVRRGQSDPGEVGLSDRCGLIGGALRLPLMPELVGGIRTRVRAALEAAEGIAPLSAGEVRVRRRSSNWACAGICSALTPCVCCLLPLLSAARSTSRVFHAPRILRLHREAVPGQHRGFAPAGRAGGTDAARQRNQGEDPDAERAGRAAQPKRPLPRSAAELQGGQRSRSRRVGGARPLPGRGRASRARMLYHSPPFFPTSQTVRKRPERCVTH